MDNNTVKRNILLAKKKVVERMAEKAKKEGRNDDYFDLNRELARIKREIRDSFGR